MAAATRFSPTPARVFLALALPFGVVLAFATPPLDVPDEPRHLQRAYLLAEGRVAPPGSTPGSGGAIPRSLLQLHEASRTLEDRAAPHASGLACRHRVRHIPDWLSTRLQPDDTVDRIPTPLLYGPVAYLPQAAGMALGRSLGLGAGAIFQLGRLANLLAWTAAGWLALVIAPRRRWALAALMLMPMSLFQASTLSADAATNALAMLVFALTLRLGFAPEAPRRRHWLGLAASCALLGLTKPGYVAFSALLLCIPPSRFRNRAQRWRTLGGVALAAAATSVAWALAVRAAGPYPFVQADPMGQLAGIAAEPWRYASVLFNTVIASARDYGLGFVGVLGRLDVRLPTAVYLLVPLLLLTAAIADGKDPELLSPLRRAGALAIFVAISLMLMTLLYVGWTPLGAAHVSGIQGRYFIALAPLLLLAIPSLCRAPGFFAWALAACFAGNLALTIQAVLERYY